MNAEIAASSKAFLLTKNFSFAHEMTMFWLSTLFAGRKEVSRTSTINSDSMPVAWVPTQP